MVPSLEDARAQTIRINIGYLLMRGFQGWLKNRVFAPDCVQPSVGLLSLLARRCISEPAPKTPRLTAAAPGRCPLCNDAHIRLCDLRDARGGGAMAQQTKRNSDASLEN